MRGLYAITSHLICILLVLCEACSSDTPDPTAGAAAEAGSGYRNLVMSVGIGEDALYSPAAGNASRSAFDNFDNELDKWGIDGENMETLRVIIIHENGVVEHNRLFSLTNATEGGTYEFRISDNEEKTIILIANEDGFHLDEEGLELAGATTSMEMYFSRLRPGAKTDIKQLRNLTLTLAHNSPDGRGKSFKTPLPIAGIFTEKIPAGAERIERFYWLQRAAVKYSFRIVNTSRFAHSLDGVRIDRVADREFLFPDADYAINAAGHYEVSAYRTPHSAREQEFAIILDSPLHLGAKMKQAVEALPAPIYVPEGIIANTPQSISLTLDDANLQIWRELYWRMPGETEATKRPMVDLPRNTHVVVNITISDDTCTAIADVQPYASVPLDPYFGLARDEDGNIIIHTYDDGSYDVLIDGQKVKHDAIGDRIIKEFDDGSILVEEKVYRDYIHEDNLENCYYYKYEKDHPAGMMVLLRELTDGGTYHNDFFPQHVNDASDIEIEGELHQHSTDDRPLFLIDENCVYYRATYNDKGNRTLSTRDAKGDLIIQANGFQFRQYWNEMKQYLGTYIVLVGEGDNAHEELRHWQTGRTLDWELGVDTPETYSVPGSRSVAGGSEIARRLRELNNRIIPGRFSRGTR